MNIQTLTSLVIIFYSIGGWFGADSAPLTPGNILAVRCSSGPTINTYSPKILEVSPESNSIVQSWDLPCFSLSDDQQLKITFSPDNTKASVVCDGYNSEIIIVSLTQTGVLTNYTINTLQNGFQIVMSAMIDGNDIWISAYDNGAFTSNVYHTSINTLSTFTMAAQFAKNNKYTNMQFFNGNLYQLQVGQGPIQYYNLADLKATLGTKPTFLNWTGPTTGSPNSPAVDFSIYSSTEVYFSIYNIGGDNSLIKSYFDQASNSWKKYSSFSLGARQFSNSALDVNGVRKVYICTPSFLVVFTDSGSAFTDYTTLATAPAGSKYADATIIPPPPTCNDNKKNQDETDVDCGGICGANCDDGKNCVDKDDCSNGFCNMNKCATPTCSDAEMNQDETDIDCGGSCKSCEDNYNCLIDTDCISLYCSVFICVTPTCNDEVKNLNETDVDCGGYCGSTCDVNQNCLVNEDCMTMTCENSKCVATCSDNLKNQDETDVDCGGNTCSNKCAVQKQCNQDSDCQTNYCDVATCAESPPVAPPTTQPQSTPSIPTENGPNSSPTAPITNSPDSTIKISSATKNVMAIILLLVAVLFV